MRAAILLRCVLAAIAIAYSPTAGAQPDNQTEDVLASVLTDAKNADGVFRIDGDHILHIQSGLRCPAHVGNALLANVFVFDSGADKGGDVGCDYGRPVEPGAKSYVAKHTIYAVRLAGDVTLDLAFSNYKEEMHSSAPVGARSGGESLTIEGGPEGFPEFRSEEMFYTSPGGRKVQTELIVATIDGWVIEMRSTRASQYAVRDAEEIIDQEVGVKLFFGAVHALGGPDFNPAFEHPGLPVPDPGTKL